MEKTVYVYGVNNNKSILMSSLIVVDDNDIDRRITKYNLVKYPLFDEVTYYDDGLAVIDYIKEHSDEQSNLPDAIFLDLSMPVYDGWDVLDEIKSIYPLLAKKIKVYILTASISPIDILRSKGYDFVSQFISKPFTKEILFSLEL